MGQVVVTAMLAASHITAIIQVATASTPARRITREGREVAATGKVVTPCAEARQWQRMKWWAMNCNTRAYR